MPNFDVSRTTPYGWPRSVVVTVREAVGPADVAPACAELRAGLAVGRPRLVVCDVASLERSDVATVDLIARLALTARISGCRLFLRGVTPDLRSLLAFAGLSDVLPCLEPSALEAER